MLIRAYGEYWSPDYVYWGPPSVTSDGELMGVAMPSGKKKDSYQVDMWAATAVYCLYHEYEAVYVGKSKQNLGQRLKAHLADRHAGRWDAFSFYSLSSALKSGTASNPGARQVSAEVTVATIEAVSIRLFDPSLNRRHERIDDAVLIEQAVPESPPTVDEQLEDLAAQLAEIRALIERT